MHLCEIIYDRVEASRTTSESKHYLNFRFAVKFDHVNQIRNKRTMK